MTDVQWRVNVPGVTFPGSGTSIDPDVADVNVVDTFRRFASSATAQIDDDGTKDEFYLRGTRIEFEYSTNGGSSWTRRWAGLIQDTIQKQQRGRDILQVEAVGYDHLLRRRDDVFKEYTTQSLSTIIQDVIETFTPVSYVGGNVTVVNDQTVSRDFEGARVDQILNELASISGGEDYGVNDDFEFFFSPRETTSAPEGILDGDWFDYDLPEEGKRAINRVRINYGSGGSESFVVVEDRASQKLLKDNLNAAGNVVLSKQKTFPNITSESAAKRKGEELLGVFSQIQTGDVTTFDRFGMEPGQTFRLQIGPKGIDDTFRIAQIEYRWRQDETVVTVAEQSVTGNDQLLVELSDDVARIDIRDADLNATGTQFLDLTSGVTVDTSLTVTRNNVSSGRFTPGLSRDQPGLSRNELGLPSAGSTNIPVQSVTVTNAGLNRFRDAWQGEAVNTIDTIKVGTGTSDASVGDTSLETLVTSFSGSASDNGSFAVDITGTLTSGGAAAGSELTEVGFFDNSNNLLIRGTFDPTLHSSNTTHDFAVTLTIDNDTEAFGVITNNGQTQLRNQWNDGTGSMATDMSFGTGTTAADETDTALGNKVIEKALSSTSDGSVGLSNVVARLTTAEANGNTLAELGEENSGNTLLSRIVYEGIAKTSDFALEANHKFRARNL